MSYDIVEGEGGGGRGRGNGGGVRGERKGEGRSNRWREGKEGGMDGERKIQGRKEIKSGIMQRGARKGEGIARGMMN